MSRTPPRMVDLAGRIESLSGDVIAAEVRGFLSRNGDRRNASLGRFTVEVDGNPLPPPGTSIRFVSDAGDEAELVVMAIVKRALDVRGVQVPSQMLSHRPRC
jgi:hypothetical protein